MKRIFPISSLTILAVWVLVSFFPNPGFPQRAKESARNSAPVTGVLRDVVIDSQPRGVKVELRGDGLAKDFKSFTLARPLRLVIDFPGVLTSFPKKFLNVDHPLLKEVRLGQHPDKLRLVLTFPKTELPPIESFGRQAVYRSSSGRSKRFRRRKSLPSRFIPGERSPLIFLRPISEGFSLSFPKWPSDRSSRAPRFKGPSPCA